MEKRGLTAQLNEIGCQDAEGLFWGDEMRLGLMGKVRKVWAPRGVKIEQAVEFQYEWAYLNLVVNGMEGKLHWNWTDNMKSASIAPVVKQWGTLNVKVIVWDQARGHQGEAYQGIEVGLIEQPPYSPQLNPAERVFEHLRAKIEGKVYGKLAAKKLAVEEELRKLVAEPEKVKRLTGWKWIRQSVEQLSKTFMAVQ